ncbi:MAG: ABC transporter ATP-binding protein [Acidipropionibacterium sp.]|jgi:putative ABC transport system ATP-binding protein|nr:ABC transporter ATP-binding protein [Acidipropionibacterium sp.]
MSHPLSPTGLAPTGPDPIAPTPANGTPVSAAATGPTGPESSLRSAVRAAGLTKTYGSGPATVRALDGVDLDLPASHLTAIMGASGSGKSTLLHCLTGLDSPTSGTVWIGGTEITRLSDDDLTRLRRDRIGFVFQSFNLMPTLTAEKNILLPLKLSRRKADRQWFDRIVGMLGLDERLGHRPSELSGGQQQRVAVARALITRPDVIVADEPTGALDSAASDGLLTFLRNCVDDLGQTVVMVTHDHHAADYADRVVTMRDGRTCEDQVAIGANRNHRRASGRHRSWRALTRDARRAADSAAVSAADLAKGATR